MNRLTFYKHLLVITIFCLLANTSYSDTKIQTTRLKSTAGVGAGSILLDEATMLNPAPVAFYQTGAI